jgi:hypothetical protein
VAPQSLIVDQRQVNLDVAAHEAGHAVSALLLGYRFEKVALDAKWCDNGWLGAVCGPFRREPRPDLTAFEEAMDAAIVVRAGAFVACQEWEACKADRAFVLSLRPRDYSVPLWEAHVGSRTRRFVRTERFHPAHARVCAALDELRGEGELSYAEVERIVRAVE